MDPFPFTSLGPRGRTATPHRARPRRGRSPGSPADSLVLRGSQPQLASGPAAPAYGSSRAVKPRSVGFANVSSRSAASADHSLSGHSGAEPCCPQWANASLVGRYGGGAERRVLQWARHGAILSLLTPRDLC